MVPIPPPMTRPVRTRLAAIALGTSVLLTLATVPGHAQIPILPKPSPTPTPTRRLQRADDGSTPPPGGGGGTSTRRRRSPRGILRVAAVQAVALAAVGHPAVVEPVAAVAAPATAAAAAAAQDHDRRQTGAALSRRVRPPGGTRSSSDRRAAAKAGSASKGGPPATRRHHGRPPSCSSSSRSDTAASRPAANSRADSDASRSSATPGSKTTTAHRARSDESPCTQAWTSSPSWARPWAATIDGYIWKYATGGRGGNAIWLMGKDGVRYYYGHMDRFAFARHALGVGCSEARSSDSSARPDPPSGRPRTCTSRSTPAATAP